MRLRSCVLAFLALSDCHASGSDELDRTMVECVKYFVIQLRRIECCLGLLRVGRKDDLRRKLRNTLVHETDT